MVEYLSALLPPSNIAREVSQIQQYLFERYGFCSALALPVLAPIHYHSEDVNKAILAQSILRLRALPVVVKGYRAEAGCLYLDFDTDVWPDLQLVLSDLSPSAGPQTTLPQGHSGFYLSCVEQPQALTAILADLPCFSLRRFASYSIALLRIEASAGTWWQQVYWHVLSETKLRRALDGDRTQDGGDLV